ncbi:hypothetical protein DN069_21605 [Streptacidiphilus pinicola]|uniref:Uncharacterized protein n=1 Tax=Streptacidiphilus pinicola TaxID=2219663 RepID=A0A2X0J7X0_9ACTN|nr:hypothetical protein [Streptacidiphilus pinicola]RAG83588.1 hypothetical protein DN069_21605 [Streptacidiphilus pinicola]
MASDKPKGKILGREDINRLIAEVKAEIAAEAIAADLQEGPGTDLGARAQRLREWAAHQGVRHAEAVPVATSQADQLIAMMSSIAFLVTCQVIDQLLADSSTD